MVRIFPIVIGAAAGAVDGALQDSDIKHSRVSNTKQFSTWFEAAAFGGGLLLDLMRFSPDVTDPLIFGGIFGLSRRAGMALGNMAAGTAPVTHMALPMARYAAVREGAAVGAPGYQYEPTNILG